jgi:hypothetical protein
VKLKTTSDFNLTLFFDFHIIYVLEVKFVLIKLLRCSFTYWKSVPNFRNHQIMDSITVNSSEASDINYIWLPHFIHQDVITLVVSFPTRRGSRVFMNVAVWEQCKIWALLEAIMEKKYNTMKRRNGYEEKKKKIEYELGCYMNFGNHSRQRS